jgi:hypothetical protein
LALVALLPAVSQATMSSPAPSAWSSQFRAQARFAASAHSPGDGDGDCDDGAATLPALRAGAVAPPPRPIATGGSPAKLVLSTALGAGSPTAPTLRGAEQNTSVAAPAASAATPLVTQNSEAPDPPTPKRLQTWDIVPADKTLNAALARWASAAGWQLVWDLPVDYAVDTRTSVTGSFEDAVRLVANSMAGAEIPLKAVFYEGNKVLRIVGKGSE